ncbi:MAG: hypothetical protein M3Z33_13760 [Actinomycetota bacterium]|nr:hypothetical protein [Actinomycetota bacterium]
MTADAVRRLEAELGGRVPEGLETLTDGELADVGDRLRDTKRRQSQALDAAIEEALEIVPRLLRGPVRKILFG